MVCCLRFDFDWFRLTSKNNAGIIIIIDSGLMVANCLKIPLEKYQELVLLEQTSVKSC